MNLSMVIPRSEVMGRAWPGLLRRQGGRRGLAAAGEKEQHQREHEVDWHGCLRVKAKLGG